MREYVALILIAVASIGVSRADNPIVQAHFGPDPAPMVYNGTLYAYVGDDIPGTDFYYMTKWRVLSTTDMVNGTDHGSPVSLESFEWARDRAWAAQCIGRNGRFYWYNVHKLYAGLRDAWLYAGNEDAKDIFLKFCDWAINITSALSDAQMQSMLDMEHGGMNEVFADAYQMTGNEKYLVAAKRFSHNMLLDAMAADNDNLDNKHANTQVPKAVGFERIAELSHDKKYAEAGSFFWETVTGNRSLAFGGNSRREFFSSVSSCTDFVNDFKYR
jgi:hypothetical protein